jgi:hypothetical protein
MLGMNEQVLDVGDSYSSLNPYVWAWLDARYPGAWRLSYHDDGYCIDFESDDHALQFTLTWL